MVPSYQQFTQLQEQGIIQTKLNLEIKYYGKYQNIYFKNQRKLIYFILNNQGYKIVTIDKSFIKMLQTRFNIKEIAARAMISNLERYKEFQKIESNMFVLAHKNKLEIAVKMLDKVKSQISKINYFTKRIFLNLISEIIIENKLLWDEPYYIFKDQYKNKFYFSSGNEMYFTTNKNYSKYTLNKRIEHFIKTPQVLGLDEMETKIGLNKFSIVNTEIVKSCGKNFLIYNDNNHNHRTYLKNALWPFIKNQQRKKFSTKDVRQFLELSNEIHIRRLSKYKQITSIVINLFHFIYYDKNKKKFIFEN